jgi:hypothetical protein
MFTDFGSFALDELGVVILMAIGACDHLSPAAAGPGARSVAPPPRPENPQVSDLVQDTLRRRSSGAEVKLLRE